MLRLKYIVLTALAMVLVFGAPCFAIWLIETYNLQRTMLGLALVLAVVALVCWLASRE